MEAFRKGRTDHPGPHWKAGNIPTNVGDWNNIKPVIHDKCSGCLLCWLLCPDGAIMQTGDKKVAVDNRLCKGCGICANECPLKAIEMVRVER